MSGPNKSYRWILLLFALTLLAPTVTSAEADQQPNIVFIFADDWGWGDLGCYGNRRIKTPNLDQLAARGTRFTQFYVNGPTCSPSRTGVMTGQFPGRHRVHGYFANPKKNRRRNMPNFLDPDAPMLTRRLQKAGYTTGHYGKWHLYSPGADDLPSPDEYGLDDWHFAHEDDWNLWAPENRPQSTKKIVDETISFIERHQDSPFFVNVWLLDTHATLNPTPEQMKPYRHLNPRGVDFTSPAAVYNAAATESDRQIGRLLDRLDQMNLAEDTIVIFSSDNGPEDLDIRNASHSGVGKAGPFRGRKRSLYEGGIRMPFIIRWPGHVPAGRVDDRSVVTGVDLLPTLCEFAGAELPDGYEPDGEDVSDMLLGNFRSRKKPILWEYRWKIFGHVIHRSPMMAIRKGPWKLLMNPDRSRVELYNIPEDPSELNNLSDEHPEVVKRLSERLMKFHRSLPDGPSSPAAGQNDYPWPKPSRKNE